MYLPLSPLAFLIGYECEVTGILYFSVMQFIMPMGVPYTCLSQINIVILNFGTVPQAIRGTCNLGLAIKASCSALGL